MNVIYSGLTVRSTVTQYFAQSVGTNEFDEHSYIASCTQIDMGCFLTTCQRLLIMICNYTPIDISVIVYGSNSLNKTIDRTISKSTFRHIKDFGRLVIRLLTLQSLLIESRISLPYTGSQLLCSASEPHIE